MTKLHFRRVKNIFLQEKFKTTLLLRQYKDLMYHTSGYNFVRACSLEPRPLTGLPIITLLKKTKLQ